MAAGEVILTFQELLMILDIQSLYSDPRTSNPPTSLHSSQLISGFVATDENLDSDDPPPPYSAGVPLTSGSNISGVTDDSQITTQILLRDYDSPIAPIANIADVTVSNATNNQRVEASSSSPTPTSRMAEIAKLDLAALMEDYKSHGSPSHYIMTSTRYLNWICHPTSSTLVTVDTETMRMRNRWLCPFISQHMSRVERFEKRVPKAWSCQTFTLTFWCGRHKASNDTLNSPSGMLQSLLSQFLSKLVEIGGLAKKSSCADIDQRVELAEVSLAAIRSYDIGSLVGLFQQLVRKTRRSYICCLIDGIPSFRPELTSRGMQFAIKELHEKLVVQAPNGVSQVKDATLFKLLLTTPTIIDSGADVWFPREKFLFMSDVQEEIGRRGVDRQLLRAIGESGKLFGQLLFQRGQS